MGISIYGKMVFILKCGPDSEDRGDLEHNQINIFIPFSAHPSNYWNQPYSAINRAMESLQSFAWLLRRLDLEWPLVINHCIRPELVGHQTKGPFSCIIILVLTSRSCFSISLTGKIERKFCIQNCVFKYIYYDGCHSNYVHCQRCDLPLTLLQSVWCQILSNRVRTSVIHNAFLLVEIVNYRLLELELILLFDMHRIGSLMVDILLHSWLMWYHVGRKFRAATYITLKVYPFPWTKKYTATIIFISETWIVVEFFSLRKLGKSRNIKIPPVNTIV